jgi:hypothetical protein
MADLTQDLSRSEVIALVDFKIENQPRETEIDRSYATIGFVAHRENSIAERTLYLPLCLYSDISCNIEFCSLHRGFDLPDKTYKHGHQVHIQKGLSGTVGLASGRPTVSATLSYARNRDFLVEATDNKVRWPSFVRCLNQHFPRSCPNARCTVQSDLTGGNLESHIRRTI